MEAFLLETRGNNFSRLRSAQAFGIALVGGAAAFALEYVRVDPTFGVGVALWLFFPLIVLSLCGGFAAMGSAAVAVTLQYSLSDYALSAFDAAIYLFTVTACCFVVWRTRQMRIIDGVLLSWGAVIPANVIYHQALFQYGLNAGVLELSSDLMSQLIPAMLVQWLAMRPRPLAPIFPRLTSTVTTEPLQLSVVARTFRLPTVVLLVLACIDFIATQSLYVRVELERSLALQRAQSAMVAVQSSLDKTSVFTQVTLEEEVTKALLTALAPPEPSAETQSRPAEQELLEQSVASGHDSRKVSSRELLDAGVRVDLVFEAGDLLKASQSEVIAKPSTRERDRSPLDWVYQREWLVQVPVTLDSGLGVVRIREDVGRPVAVNYRAMVWGLLATFLLLGGLLSVYQRWGRRVGESVRHSLDQFAAWQPGDVISLALPVERGLILEIDSVRDSLQGLIDKFNANYDELNQVSSDRQRLLGQLGAIYTAVREPVIVVDEGFQLNEALSNPAGMEWGRRLKMDFAELARAIPQVGQPDAACACESRFAKILLGEIQGRQVSDKSAVRLTDGEGKTSDFYVSVGAIERRLPADSVSEEPSARGGEEPSARGGEEPSAGVGEEPSDRGGKEPSAGGGFVILLSDVSALIAARKALEHQSKLTALGGLASGIAHELNQPLNAIRMALANMQRRMTLQTLDGATLASKIERLDEQVSRMGVLIKAMRAYSADENVNPLPVEPNSVLQDILTTMNHELADHHITITTEGRAENCRVTANPNVLGRLFAEVLGNAIDALKVTSDGLRELVVRQKGDGRAWVLEIEDSGEGFLVSDEARLFEPFYTTKDDVKHAGLGLSTAWQIAQDLGGDIALERRANRTVATIRLPLESAIA